MEGLWGREGQEVGGAGEVGVLLEATVVKRSELISAQRSPEPTIPLALDLRGGVEPLRTSVEEGPVVLTSLTNFGGICHDITVT